MKIISMKKSMNGRKSRFMQSPIHAVRTPKEKSQCNQKLNIVIETYQHVDFMKKAFPRCFAVAVLRRNFMDA